MNKVRTVDGHRSTVNRYESTNVVLRQFQKSGLSALIFPIVLLMLLNSGDLWGQCTSTFVGTELTETFDVGGTPSWTPVGTDDCGTDWVQNPDGYISAGDNYCGNYFTLRQVIINGPCLDLSNMKSAQISFDYRHISNQAVQNLFLQVQQAGSTAWTTVWTKGTGNRPAVFTNETTLLNDYLGEVISIRFTAAIRAGFELFNISFGTIDLDNIVYTAEVDCDKWSFANNNATFDCGNVGIGTDTPTRKLDVRGITNIGDTESRNFLEIKSDVRPEIQFHTPTSPGDIKVGVAEADDTATGVGEGDFYVQSANASDNMPLIVTKTGDVNLVNKDGNVGIGTTTPSEKLEVNGNTSLGSLSENTFVEIKSLNDPEIHFTTPTSDGDIRIGVASDPDATTGVETGDLYIASNTSGSAPVIISPSGDVALVNQTGSLGVGTTAPTTKLDVRGSASIGDTESINNIEIKSSESPEVVFSTATSDKDMSIGVAHADNQGAREGDLYIKSASAGSLPLIVGQDGNVYLVNLDGSVGIGTNSPGEYKLAVEGTIGARKVKVTTEAWADYVFEAGYELPPLSFVEAYIREHGHLPNVDPAAKVIKDGIDLGEMNVKLMEKIEELTLYIIQQEKRIQALEEKVKRD